MRTTRTPSRTARLAMLLGTGALLTQTSSCALDGISNFIQTFFISYTYDSVLIIFKNLLNV